MRRILAVFMRDFNHVRGNAIALLVCMGLAIMPSLYAWFNIAGGWDPYANTGQVKVALANSDRGITGTVLPFTVNVGERVVSSLAGSDKIGYVVTSEDKAVDGVRSGEYYAAVVIPKNFSSDLLSVLSSKPTHPELDYYVNEKRNAIASIVTGKASGSVQGLVDKGFTESMGTVVTEVFSEISSTLDDDGLLSVASNLSGALNTTLDSLERSADDLMAYKAAVASIREVMQTSASLVGSDSASLDAAGALEEAADGVREFDAAAQTATSAAGAAIDDGKAATQRIEDAVNEAFNSAGEKADELSDALDRIDATAHARRDDLQRFYDSLERLDGTLVDLHKELEAEGHLESVSIQYTLEVTNDISDLLSRTKNALDTIDELLATVQKTRDDLKASRDNVDANRETLKGLAQQATQEIEAVRGQYQNNLSGSLGNVADAIDEAAGKAADISSGIEAESAKISPMVDDATTGLSNLETSLDNAAQKLRDTANKLRKISEALASAATSGNLDLVRTILSGDPATLVDFLASPVQLDRNAIFAVENNGSAMTPYYTTMALWVGGTLMGVLLYVGISKRAQQETGAKPRHAYFGRLLFFLAIGAIQSTILLLGDVFFLGVQCNNPVLFLVTGWVASTVFINIIYSLATSFGDVGKAIAVFIMVVQVAGSGGTFPVEMLPKPFQIAYPFLPFVHSENAMRAAMFGVYNNDWIMEIGLLLAFLIPALLLGILLRKPFVPVNEWIEEKMEETKLM
ncbi:MAG: YhgE/Pip domain-containing protein [Coriobacteriales bacterium]|nr:YhgE/Pip domain-containing protein [Coriobacteriales bacterium]